MLSERAPRFLLSLLIMFLSYECSVPSGHAQEPKRPFTVADDIQVAVFAGSWGADEELLFSPDGIYFAVETERGRPDLNGPEDSLRFYRCQDVEDFLQHPNASQTPSPIWVVNRSTDREGPILKQWRWLPDSSGMAFLERTSGSSYRLVLADLRKKTIEPLTSGTQAVDHFDVRDRQHYVYTGTDPSDREKLQAEHQAPAIVGTGRSISQLLTVDPAKYGGHRNFYLWAVVGGKHFEVKQNGAPLIPDGELALSPDSSSVVAALPIPEVPPSWETLYPPPFASDAYRIHAGVGSAHQWVRINLRTDSIRSLTDAPRSEDAGLWAGVFSGPRWSSDGQAILLPGTFLKSKENAPSRPCVAVADLAFNTRTCVEVLKGRTESGAEEGFHHIQEARFAGGDKQRIIVRFRSHEDLYSFGTIEYQRTADGTWQLVGHSKSVPEVGHDGLEVSVKQGLNEPPLVVGTYKQRSHVIWDPNPQLKNIELGQARVYKWKDKEGREWRGGLFKPSDYQPGQRYPLVIQGHGFTESKFIPSGIFPTAFAARELAAAGIVVLQLSEGCPAVTRGEGPCAVSGYEAAVNQLVSEGLVDPDKIGMIGFSRTCFYVMETLTTGSLHLRAASITEGLMADYLQYLFGPDWVGDEYNAMIGAAPFGEGLQTWLTRSPGFNLDKIHTPLMVVGEGPLSVLHMWEPYAVLRYLHKPVDLIMLNTDEHVLTNPTIRLASQGGSVDWFRFWLQDYEDPDSAKGGQYARWRELRKLQEEIDKKR